MQLITGRTDTPGALTAFHKVFRDVQDAPGMCTALRPIFPSIRVLKKKENAANLWKEPTPQELPERSTKFLKTSRHNFQKIRVLKNSENAANHKKEPDCKAEQQFL